MGAAKVPCYRQGSHGGKVRARRQEEQLEAFANACPMRGEKLVACDMLSIYNDRWFGQWLVLRKPFRSMEELLVAEVVEKARIGGQEQ